MRVHLNVNLHRRCISVLSEIFDTMNDGRLERRRPLSIGKYRLADERKSARQPSKIPAAMPDSSPDGRILPALQGFFRLCGFSNGFYADSMRIYCGFFTDLLEILCGFLADSLMLLPFEAFPLFHSIPGAS